MVVHIDTRRERELSSRLMDFNDSELQTFLQKVKILLLASGRVSFLDEKESEVDCVLKSLLEKKTLIKYEKAEALGEFLSSEKNVYEFFKSFHSSERSVFKKLYDAGLLSSLLMSEREFDDLIEVEESNYTRRLKLKNRFMDSLVFIRSASWSAGERKNMFMKFSSLGFLLYTSFRKTEEKWNIWLKGESELDGLLIANQESQLYRCMPIMKSLQESGDFKTDAKFKTTSTQIKKAANKAGFVSFISNSAPLNEFTLALPVLCYFQWAYPTHKLHEQIALAASAFAEDQSCHFLHYFLPFVSGFSASRGVYDLTDRFVYLKETLIESDGWIRVPGLSSHLCNYNYDSYTSSLLTDIYNVREVSYVNKLTGMSIAPQNLVSYVNELLTRSICCYLVGLGIVEVAYHKYDEQRDETPLDCMEYIRITNLGRYVYRLSESYTPPSVKKERNFELDSEHLIIRDTAECNPYLNILLDIAQPIGNKRYCVTSASFLHSCKNELDVNNKIAAFKEYVSSDFPSNWEEFFREMLYRCSPFTPLMNDSFEIYQLDKNNKKMIDLLVKDSVLREIIIRADGYKILVEKKNIKKFISRLKDFGYLIG